MVEIKFSNAEVGRPIFMQALNILASKALPAKPGWDIADFTKKVGEQIKAYNEAMVKIFRENGATEKDGAYSFPAGSVTQEITDGIEELNSVEVTYKFEYLPFKLPEKEKDGTERQYEPVIQSVLEKLLLR